MIAVAALSVAILALAPFAARLADWVRPAPSLKPVRVAGPNLAAFDACPAWGWA